MFEILSVDYQNNAFELLSQSMAFSNTKHFGFQGYWFYDFQEAIWRFVVNSVSLLLKAVLIELYGCSRNHWCSGSIVRGQGRVRINISKSSFWLIHVIINSMYIKSELWLITIYQCGFTDYNKCTTWVENVDNGRGYVCLAAGLYRDSLYFTLTLVVHLNLLKSIALIVLL